MKKYTVLAVVAGAVALFGVSAVTSYSVAEPRGSWGGHDGGPGSHGMRHHKMGGHHGMKRHGMRGHGRRHGSGMGMTYLMERFDSDKNGKLTQDELNKARESLLGKHDGNKDGALTLAEFSTLWLEVMHRRMVRNFQHMDEDGDASISLDEFLKPYANVVARKDRNGDGTLDKEDRRHRSKKWHDRQRGGMQGSEADKSDK